MCGNSLTEKGAFDWGNSWEMCLFPFHECKTSSFFQERKMRALMALVNVSLFFLCLLPLFSCVIPMPVCVPSITLKSSAGKGLSHSASSHSHCLLVECLAHSGWSETHVNMNISRTMDQEQRVICTSEMTLSLSLLITKMYLITGFSNISQGYLETQTMGRYAQNTAGERKTA